MDATSEKRRSVIGFLKHLFRPSGDNNLHLCGLFGWHPGWLQKFNDIKAFMLCLVCIDIFRGMYASNFSSMLPSIQQRFGFSSQSVGIIKAMSDISHLLVALFVAHYGGSSHRPRWMAFGTLIVGLGLLLMASPEFLFPASSFEILTTTTLAKANVTEQFCDANRNNAPDTEEIDSNRPTTDHVGPMVVFGIAEFIIGLGSTTTRILGLPFIDDNVQTKNSPIYFAISFAGVLLGPLVGISMAGYFNTIFFDFSVPDFKSSDPRWISAWYMAFIIGGFGLLFFSLVLSCFPSRLQQKTVKVQNTNGADGKSKIEKSGQNAQPHRHAVKEIPRKLKSLLTNKLYVLNLLNQLMIIAVMSGAMSFMQIFLKQQYQLPQAVSSTAGGIPPMFAAFIGIISGGYVLRRYKLRPRQVVTMMAVSSLVSIICYFSVLALGCPKSTIVGLDSRDRTPAVETCYQEHHCQCDEGQFAPVCNSAAHTTFLSPCYAGCQSSARFNGSKIYTNCTCAGQALREIAIGSANEPRNAGPAFRHDAQDAPHITSGMCKQDCWKSFVGYVALMSVAKFCMGIPLAGMLMLQFRIVDVDMKSMANAVSTVVTSTLGTLPAPILAGKLIDTACILWQKSARGTHGACWIYDMDDFRYKLHASVACVYIVLLLLEIALAYNLKQMTFDRTEDEEKNSPEVAAGGDSNQVAVSTLII
ncbi:hypothetical protein RvY_11974 [Ramazzottius varieornatus]|uniref:Solute carrier organic anion transporter family member n=1 Tax=Ramazzottius varieornatus TaxID=947166 RepID=A0A1D1VM77_RAMVA|nr:hypothetical protein RvY_11974 [Ramazzottius varieornatus]